MATENYKKMIDEICAIAKISHSQALYARADLTVDGVNFTLADASVEAEDALALYCDFGAPPAKKRIDVLERLLQINLVMHGAHTPLFGINAETGHVLLGRRVPIGQTSALALMTQLTEYAAHAKEWRQTFYLVEPGKPMAASA